MTDREFLSIEIGDVDRLMKLIQKTSVSSKASFVTPAEIYSEVTRRQRKCWPARLRRFMGNSGILVARKLILLSTGARGAVYPLVEPKVALGRDDENAIQLEEPSISRRHAVLERMNGEYVLRDLHSSNGTFLNDELVQEAPLKPGDRLRLGDIELGYEAVGDTNDTNS